MKVQVLFRYGEIEVSMSDTVLVEQLEDSLNRNQGYDRKYPWRYRRRRTN